MGNVIIYLVEMKTINLNSLKNIEMKYFSFIQIMNLQKIDCIVLIWIFKKTGISLRGTECETEIMSSIIIIHIYLKLQFPFIAFLYSLLEYLIMLIADSEF